MKVENLGGIVCAFEPLSELIVKWAINLIMAMNLINKQFGTVGLVMNISTAL